ncbi:kinase-like domain-containing protein [Gigaspora rosea]|uniref:Kinase-like domain-containing protein n=1 Tax=Gigaspora rosea TaxID=44941 RepID=A0A397VR03_9GLOM|nr:kinase-like domain-containing protein [Gigaspora rosea]
MNNSMAIPASASNGAPAYIDPQYHIDPRKKPDENSDIYSLGVIFWELTSGTPSFGNAENRFIICIQILQGYREEVIPNTPSDYAELYKCCWDSDPQKRPSLDEILEVLDEISSEKAAEFITNSNRQPKPILTKDNSHDLLSVESSAKIIEEPDFKVSCTKSLFRPRSFQKSVESSKLKAQGIVYFAAKNYEGSLEFLNKSLSINPNDADALKFRGITYFKLKNYEKSLTDLTKSLNSIKNDAVALIFRGQVYYTLGHYKESLYDLNKSLELDPNNPFALRCRGQTYHMLNHYEESLADLNKSLKYDLNNADTLRSRGQTYYELKLYEESLADLDRSIELEPNNAITLRSRGQTYYMLERYEESLGDLTKSIEIDPNNTVALIFRGQSYFKMKKYEESLADFTKTLEIDSDNVIALRFSGEIYFKLGKFAESLKNLEIPLKIDENDVGALQIRSQIYYKQKEYVNSLKDLDKALELDPKNANLLRSRGQAHYCLEKYIDSLGDFTDSLKIEPDNAFTLRCRGQAYYMMKNYEESLADLNKSIELEPEDAVALRFRGQTYYMLNRYDEYDVDLTRLSKINPDNAAILKSIEKEHMIDNYNKWLENAISQQHIRKFDYNEFETFKRIGEGGFGTVFKAEWKYHGLPVVIKSLKDNMRQEFFKELQILLKVSFHPNINHFYGVTKDPETGIYSLVLQYAEGGNLRGYLRVNFPKLQWSDKLRIAKEIAQGLMFLHNNNVAHRDLHSKNVLVHEDKMMIADFGLSRQINEPSITSGAHGMPAYREPQCFNNPSYIIDLRSDIYSFGVILWEISSGRPPFQSFELEASIVVHIFQGNREIPVEGTPSEYTNLYVKCWDSDPDKRPNIKSVYETLNQFNPRPEKPTPQPSKGWLDDAILNEQIKYYDYNEFSNFKKIGEGMFGSVYKSELRNPKINVVLKYLSIDASFDDDVAKKLIKEIQFLQEFTSHPNVVKFYGITTDPSNSYIMVFQSAEDGNLREYFKKNFTKLQWIDKLHIAKEIAMGLVYLHENDLIHRNLHPKNILVHEKKIMITDFGLYKLVNEVLKNSNTTSQEMPEYKEPECLKDFSYERDKKSDIYSFGVILWEISSGKPPFQSMPKYSIPIHIFQGNRESPVEGTAAEYVELYTKCWDEDPTKRPDIKSVIDILDKLIDNEETKA